MEMGDAMKAKTAKTPATDGRGILTVDGNVMITGRMEKRIRTLMLSGKPTHEIAERMKITVEQLQKWRMQPGEAMTEIDGLVAGEVSGTIMRVLLENARRMEKEFGDDGTKRLDPKDVKDMAIAAQAMRKLSGELFGKAKEDKEATEDEELEIALDRQRKRKMIEEPTVNLPKSAVKNFEETAPPVEIREGTQF